MKLLKKILCGILSATMLITSAAIPAMADEDIKVTLDGKALSFDVPPQIINDRTMVPLRAIFEALGASVDWNQATKTVTSTKGDTTIKLTIDSNTMYVNNNIVTLDTPACVVNDRTLVPVRAISEAYNTNVDWNGDTKTVIISSNAVSTTIQVETTKTAFSKVKDYIITNGTQNVKTEDEEYYVYVDNGDLLLKQNLIIKLSYNVDNNTINMYLGQSSNATFDEGVATINIYIKEDTEPTLEFYAGEMVQSSLSTFEIYGYFDKNTRKFVETETKNFGKTAKLGATEHNLFNSYLKLFGMGYLLANTGATLNDLGVYIDLSDVNVNTNTESKSTNTNNITYNAPSPLSFARLMWKIVDNGAYMAEQNTYGILEQLTDTIDICLLCKMEDNDKKLPESISLILTTENSNYVSQTTLILHESSEPSAVTTFTSKYGEDVCGGNFSPSDGKFYKTYGNIDKSEEQDSIDIINNALGFFDNYLQIKDYGVTISDFGITY